MKEITVVAKDRIGLLADVSEALSEGKLNIESVSVETSSRTAIIRLVMQHADRAKHALEKAGFKVLDTDALVIGMPDHPGELAKVSRLLADGKIRIESVFVLNKEGDKTVLALKVDDYDVAKKILKQAKYL